MRQGQNSTGGRGRRRRQGSHDGRLGHRRFGLRLSRLGDEMRKNRPTRRLRRGQRTGKGNRLRRNGGRNRLRLRQNLRRLSHGHRLRYRGDRRSSRLFIVVLRRLDAEQRRQNIALAGRADQPTGGFHLSDAGDLRAVTALILGNRLLIARQWPAV